MNNEFKCSTCTKVFSNLFNLNRHKNKIKQFARNEVKNR